MTDRAKLRRQYRQLVKLCAQTAAARPVLFFGFLMLTTFAAITEGAGVGLLIPLIQQTALSTGGVLPGVDHWLTAILPANPAARTADLAGVLALVILARGVLQIFSSYLAIMLPTRVQASVSITNYERLLDAGLDFFAQSDGGIIRTLVQEYPQRIASSIKSITDILASAMMALIYTILMLSVSWSMTLVAIMMVGCSGVLLKRLLTLPLARNGIALSGFQERWNSLIYETGIGVKLIRLLGAEPIMQSAFRKVVHDVLRKDAQRQLIGEAQSPLMTTVGGLFVCGMLIYGSRVSTGADTAHLLVLVLCLYRLTAPISRILTCMVIIDSNLDAITRLENFALTVDANRQLDGKQRFSRLQQGLKFAKVSFTYPNADRAALQDFDLEIRRGEMVALVGPSGAGKTSVVNLLGRLYEPQQGRILVDGIDLRDYEISTWRRRLAVVTQDITLFNMSVADNLSFGQKDITAGELEEAARRAAALDFIKELPEAWQTPLGDRGVRLSGGQQQRLSIARAMLRDPELLILDEATSQLDTLTERSVQDMISSYRGARTILVVAHRLSTIRSADRIAVMRGGQIIEIGTHDELTSGASHYRSMVEAQQLDLVPELA